MGYGVPPAQDLQGAHGIQLGNQADKPGVAPGNGPLLSRYQPILQQLQILALPVQVGCGRAQGRACSQGIQPLPVQPLPTITYAAVRFLNAAYGYPAFRVYVGNRRAAGLLNFASLSGYTRLAAGYQTVTVTGTDGYIYIQKTIPFESGGRFTVAVINRPGGLDLLRITDTCCFAPSRAAHFRVGNLARNSGALDVLLPDGRAAYSDVRFKEITSFKHIAPGAYEFLFAETNQLPAPAYTDIETLDSAFIGANPLPDTAASVYLQVTRGRAYTVYLLQSGQGYNAISPLVVEDAI